MQTIVVATDFSDHAAAARGWAQHLARQHAAELVLVHAFEAGRTTSPEFGPVLRGHHDAIAGGIEARLEAEAKKSRAAGVTVSCELTAGVASAGVIAAAKRHHADLIVAGTRGRSGWKRMLLGSTAAAIVRNAFCPVVTVPATRVRWPVRTMLVATDFSEDAGLAADAAVRSVGRTTRGPRLVLLHAYDVPSEATYLPARLLAETISVVDAEVKRMIEAQAASLRDTGITVDTLTCRGYPPRVILDQMKAVRADLVAMGSRGRSGIDRVLLGNTAERVLGSASCPVLTVRLAGGRALSSR